MKSLRRIRDHIATTNPEDSPTIVVTSDLIFRLDQNGDGVDLGALWRQDCEWAQTLGLVLYDLVYTRGATVVVASQNANPAAYPRVLEAIALGSAVHGGSCEHHDPPITIPWASRVKLVTSVEGTFGGWPFFEGARWPGTSFAGATECPAVIRDVSALPQRPKEWMEGVGQGTSTGMVAPRSSDGP